MAIIDWYTYTIPVSRADQFETNRSWMNAAFAAIPKYIDTTNAVWGSAKRAGVTTGINIGNHTYIWLHHQGTLTIEHTGKGCHLLEMSELLYDVIDLTHDRATRIDIAIDLHDSTYTLSPEDIAKTCTNERIKARGFQSSDTGTTVYLGSQKSDRFARVYRYNKPHPRADAVRVEYVMKKTFAKEIARLIAEGETPEDIADRQHSVYGWTHERMLPDSVKDAVKVQRESRSVSKTVMWLYSTVAPSLARLIASGDIDLDDFLKAVKASE